MQIVEYALNCLIDGDLGHCYIEGVPTRGHPNREDEGSQPRPKKRLPLLPYLYTKVVTMTFFDIILAFDTEPNLTGYDVHTVQCHPSKLQREIKRLVDERKDLKYYRNCRALAWGVSGSIDELITELLDTVITR